MMMTCEAPTEFERGVGAVASQDSFLHVQVFRGDFVESEHLVEAILLDAYGDMIEGWGPDLARFFFPRSAIKPLQCLPLILSGAAQHFHLDSTQIALACASHNGEACHTSLVLGWLDDLGLDPSFLECGPHPPIHLETAWKLQRDQVPYSAVHNNCSGKHSGILTVCRHLGHDPRGYRLIDHPVQQLMIQTLGEWCQLDLDDLSYAVDGCAIPTIRMTLKQMALGMARLAKGWGGGQEQAACQKIREAMIRHPTLVSGQDRFCHDVHNLSEGRVVAKVGAEGLYGAMIPSRGWGLALKVLDGQKRAAEVALYHILKRYQLVKPHAFHIANTRQDPVGHLAMVFPTK